MSLAEAWEEQAANWIPWARTPGHDGFWAGTWPELQAVLPSPDGLVIEIGCGEGRVGRELLRLGHPVVGVERSSTLAHAARYADRALTVIQADAARLSLADEVASMVVACMSLQDIDDLSAAVSEAARVLRPGGQLCVAMLHPFVTALDPSSFRSDQPVVREPYLVQRRFDDHVERDGLAVTMASTHRPLSAYMSAFAAAGFMVSALREFGTKSIPWLLVLRAEKVR